MIREIGRMPIIPAVVETVVGDKRRRSTPDKTKTDLYLPEGSHPTTTKCSHMDIVQMALSPVTLLCFKKTIYLGQKIFFSNLCHSRNITLQYNMIFCWYNTVWQYDSVIKSRLCHCFRIRRKKSLQFWNWVRSSTLSIVALLMKIFDMFRYGWTFFFRKKYQNILSKTNKRENLRKKSTTEKNKTKVISADLLEFYFDLDLNFYDIFRFCDISA